MTKILLALCASQVAGLDLFEASQIAGRNFHSVDAATQYARDLESKSTADEHEIMKTLLKARGQWHPRAEALVQEVAKRPAPSGRRLATTPGDVCQADTEALCNTQVDTQCKPCKWEYGSCSANECGHYKDEATCCANANKIKTGCAWSGSSCYVKDCSDVKSWGTGSDEDEKCDAQPGCTAPCKGDAKATFKECEVGAASAWTCVEGKTKQATTGVAMDGDVALAALGQALTSIGNDPCTILDCAVCMKTTQCAQKPTKAMTGECKARCTGFAKTEADVKCLFCGQKAAGCTMEQPTPFASCTTVALTDVVKPVQRTTCKASCDSANSACSAAGVTDGNCKCTITPDANGMCVQPLVARAPTSSVAVTGLLALVAAKLL